MTAIDKKGFIMKINNKKNHLSPIRVSFIMILFAMCLAMNVFLCSSNDLYGPLDKTTAIETWAASESTIVNGDGNITAHLRTSFLNRNNSYNETMTKEICTSPIIAVIPKGFPLFLFLVIAFLFSFLTLFILLPDGWTLINLKVRLDN